MNAREFMLSRLVQASFAGSRYLEILVRPAEGKGNRPGAVADHWADSLSKTKNAHLKRGLTVDELGRIIKRTLENKRTGKD